MKNCLNTEGFGEPIAKIVNINSSKMKRNSKNKTINNPNECQYCFKKTTSSNKARHLKICSVKNKTFNQKSNDIICVNNKETKQIKNPMTEIKVNDNEIVQMIPNINKECFVSYISGQSGSGKSYFANNLAEECYIMYGGKRPIYLFSLLTEDKSLTCKHIKRIRLDDKFINMDLTLDDIKRSLLIMDDIDTIKSKAIKTKLNHIIDTVLQVGRHAEVSLMYISHLACNGKDTKMILAECNNITIFPQTMGNCSIKYLLSEYFRLDKKQIEKIKKLDSRHITIVRTYPMVLLYDKGAILLSSLDD